MQRLSSNFELVKPISIGSDQSPPILSDEQRIAVECQGSLVVHAGAGAGKTSVLAHRVAYFISQGVDPFEILVVAFSVKAACELRDRITSLLSAEQASRITVCTLHALGLRILRDYSDMLGYPKQLDTQTCRKIPRVCDGQERIRILRHAMRTESQSETLLAVQRLSIDEIADAISLAKCQGKTPQEVAALAQTPLQRGLSGVYQRYCSALQSSATVDFDDLVLGPISLLSECAEAREFYQSRWQRVLVDEMQDLNAAQYRFLCQLAEGHRQLTVIGDSAQSVFGFRGAMGQDGFMRFRADFPEAQEVYLPHNFRSSATIVTVGDALLRAQGRRQIAMRPSGQAVSLIRHSCEQREANMVAEAINQAVNLGSVQFSDCAVLCRTNAQFSLIEHALAIAKVPYAVLGRGGFFSHTEVAQLLSFLKLSQDFVTDSMSLQAIAGVNAWLSPETQANLLNQAGELLSEVLFDAEFLSKLTERQRAEVTDFQVVLLQLDERKEMSPIELIEFVLADDGCAYTRYLRNTVPATQLADAQIRISALLELARPFQKTSEFLDEMALWSGENPLSLLPYNQVSVLTLHDAKGLEFRMVFLTGMEEGLIPHFKARDTRRGLEEELRLAYVGFTRATDVLCISYAQTRNGRPATSSSFLRGLPANLVQFVLPHWEQLSQGGAR